jgi:Transposase DDE domain.
MKIIKETIKTIKKLAKQAEFKNEHKSKPNNFIRERKLDFSSIILFVLGLTNTSFDFERINFCEAAGIESISNAALSKARDKVSFTAFRALLSKTQKLIPTNAKFKGYRVIAIDGIKGELPNTRELMEKYKPAKTAQYPSFHAVASFDVLNCKFIDAEFAMSTTDERESAYSLLENHQAENDLFLFDRGFPSVALIQKLNELGLNFVARVSKSFIKEVNEFTSQKYLDKDIHIDYTARRAATNRVKGLQLPYSFDLRCVKIILSSGETEVLITNLPRDTFKRKEIGHLYSLRWGIEIGFNHLKNAINIEEFVGIKENSIKQEFYSVLIKYNLVMQYIGEAETVAYWNKKNFKIGV